MRKTAVLFAAASLAVAGIGIGGCQPQDNTDMTGSTHGGVRTGTAGMASRNPSHSPSLGRVDTGAVGTMDARTAGARGTAGTGAGGVGAGTGAQYDNQGNLV